MKYLTKHQFIVFNHEGEAHGGMILKLTTKTCTVLCRDLKTKIQIKENDIIPLDHIIQKLGEDIMAVPKIDEYKEFCRIMKKRHPYLSRIKEQIWQNFFNGGQ